MWLTRIYHPETLSVNKNIVLNEAATRHVGLVLRLKINDQIILFNGDGADYVAEIKEINRKNSTLIILEKINMHRESNLKLHLFQAISRSEKMDWIIQKAVELGVTEITPIMTDYCFVKFNPKKMEHWQKVIISACEQSGRNVIPVLHAVKQFYEVDKHNIIMFDPEGSESLSKLKMTNILIGPEGGFSEKEIMAVKHVVKLGNRVLRTETAPLAAISAIQTLYGDFC